MREKCLNVTDNNVIYISFERSIENRTYWTCLAKRFSTQTATWLSAYIVPFTNNTCAYYIFTYPTRNDCSKFPIFEGTAGHHRAPSDAMALWRCLMEYGRACLIFVGWNPFISKIYCNLSHSFIHKVGCARLLPESCRELDGRGALCMQWDFFLSLLTCRFVVSPTHCAD